MGHGRTIHREQDSTLTRCVRIVERCANRVTRPAQDMIQNWRYVRADRQRIAVFRHPHGRPNHYQTLLDWLAEQLPEVRRRLELHLLPCRIRDWSRYALVIPWVSDSLLANSPQACREACVLTTTAESHGVPVINSPPRLLNAACLDSWPTQRAAGSPHTGFPSAARLECVPPRFAGDAASPAGGRTDDAWRLEPSLPGATRTGHAPHPAGTTRRSCGRAIHRRAEPAGRLAAQVPLSGTGGDRRGPGLGDLATLGNAAAALSSPTPPLGPSSAYCEREDPNHDQFQELRRALGLDLLAIDYSYDQQGQPVIWDIDVLPEMSWPRETVDAHQRVSAERAMAAAARMWLQRARLEIPAQIEQFLATPAAATRRLAA